MINAYSYRYTKSDGDVFILIFSIVGILLYGIFSFAICQAGYRYALLFAAKVDTTFVNRRDV